MKIMVKSYKDDSSLFSSIIFFILGALLIAKADSIFNTISLILGIILLISSIFNLISYISNYKKSLKLNYKIFLFLLFLSISIVLLCLPDIVKITFNFLIGGWILLSGIKRLINSFNYKHKLPSIILSSLLIILGIYSILDGTSILTSTIGIIMVLYATFEIIGYILNTREEPEKEKDDKVLITSKSKKDKKYTKKTKRIKDVEAK